jgi:thiamine-phosphate pyrophosphorylase
MPDIVRVRGLYAIADTQYLKDARLIAAVGEAIAGGAKLVQYRDKGADPARRRDQARALLALCRRHGVAFIVNDDVRLAAALGADGAHVGRDDPALTEARRQLGANRLIGVSCYNELERALTAQSQGADYVAFGSFFPSRTKPQAARASVELLRAARAQLHIPIVAIGGITPENGADLLAAGADALAVIDGVFNRPDIRAAAQRYANLFTTTADSA